MNTLKALTLDGLKSFYIKYIKPIKNAAYCTVVNNGTTTTSNTVLDGRMGKTLADKDANLQSQIDTLNNDISKPITVPSTNGTTIYGAQGGWKKIGNLVFVSVRFKLTNRYQHAVIMYGFPPPINSVTALHAYNESAARPATGQVKSSGNLEWHDSALSNRDDACIITGAYICN